MKRFGLVIKQNIVWLGLLLLTDVAFCFFMWLVAPEAFVRIRVLPNGKEVKVNNHPDATVYPDGTAVSVYWEPDKAVVIHTKEDKVYDAIEDAVLK